MQGKEKKSIFGESRIVFLKMLRFGVKFWVQNTPMASKLNIFQKFKVTDRSGTSH